MLTRPTGRRRRLRRVRRCRERHTRRGIDDDGLGAAHRRDVALDGLDVVAAAGEFALSRFGHVVFDEQGGRRVAQRGVDCGLRVEAEVDDARDHLDNSARTW